jgi:hypothetical protein
MKPRITIPLRRFTLLLQETARKYPYDIIQLLQLFEFDNKQAVYVGPTANRQIGFFGVRMVRNRNGRKG